MRRWEPIADSRPNFGLLHAAMLGPVVLAGLTYGDRHLGDFGEITPVPSRAADELRSVRVPVDAGGGAAGCLVTRCAPPPPSSYGRCGSTCLIWQVGSRVGGVGIGPFALVYQVADRRVRCPRDAGQRGAVHVAAGKSGKSVQACTRG